MLSIEHVRALVAILIVLCLHSFQSVAACDPDFDDGCICDRHPPLPRCHFDSDHHPSTAAIIAGSIVAGVALICCIIGGFLYKRRRDRLRVVQVQTVPNPTFGPTYYGGSEAPYTGDASYPSVSAPVATHFQGNASPPAQYSQDLKAHA
ncbi:hypothetical protein D9758_012856 [Tetrapyrgos nigripes]|uniref:Uncharacterized protein n=1 Tax=Tetrapyrgos nigripes TaxID=182062 RepID=A0A8H5CBU9_9AGAR|nr:hypothetical protein D9758_012856 [Tetrapyrgos nigripes]